MNMDAKTSPSQQSPLQSEKPQRKPVRTRRWLIIVGGALLLLVVAIVGFNAFRNHMIAQFFANMKPPPTVVAVAEAKSEVLPNLLTAVGDLAAINQVNVTTDVSGRVPLSIMGSELIETELRMCASGIRNCSQD